MAVLSATAGCGRDGLWGTIDVETAGDSGAASPGDAAADGPEGGNSDARHDTGSVVGIGDGGTFDVRQPDTGADRLLLSTTDARPDVASDTARDVGADRLSAETISQTCTSTGCSQTCVTGQTCHLTCVAGVQGGCVQVCAEGSTCTTDCKGSGCAQWCSTGASCDFDCTGGGCSQLCRRGAVCHIVCAGGGCVAVGE